MLDAFRIFLLENVSTAVDGPREQVELLPQVFHVGYLHQGPVHHAVHCLVPPEPHLRHETEVVHRDGAVIVDDQGPVLRDVVKPDPLLAVIHLAVGSPDPGADVACQHLCLFLCHHLPGDQGVRGSH